MLTLVTPLDVCLVRTTDGVGVPPSIYGSSVTRPACPIGFLATSDPSAHQEGNEVRIFKKAAGVLCLAVLAVGTLPVLPAQASLSQPAVVSENPADTTPHIVLSDTSYDVRAYAQVGHTIYAGGKFREVQDPARTTTYARQNFVAFDSETGVVSPLDLSFDGTVGAIEATADGTALFIAGAFTKVNGITRRGILKYDLVNDRIDPTFAPTGMRTVNDVVLANGALIAAGNFTKTVMAMNPTTGADTGAINITVAGTVNPDDDVRVRHIAVSPDGTVGGHGQLRHGQQPEPQARLHADPRRHRDAQHLVRAPLRRELPGGRQPAGMGPGRGFLPRRLLLRDRLHRGAERHHERDV